MPTDYSVVLVTIPGRDKADALAEALVKGRLAACVNILPGVSSVYWWKEKLERSEELLLVIKTRGDLVPELCEAVRKNHPHSVPEVLALPIGDGYPPYLDWLGAHTRFAAAAPRRERP